MNGIQCANMLVQFNRNTFGRISRLIIIAPGDKSEVLLMEKRVKGGTTTRPPQCGAFVLRFLELGPSQWPRWAPLCLRSPLSMRIWNRKNYLNSKLEFKSHKYNFYSPSLALSSWKHSAYVHAAHLWVQVARNRIYPIFLRFLALASVAAANGWIYTKLACCHER